MAITTMAGVRSGLTQPIFIQKNNTTGTGTAWRSYWASAGYPAAGAYDTTLNGVALSSTAGGIPFTNPASGNTYFAGFKGFPQIYANQPVGYVMLADRLWHNGGYTITSTSAQNSTTPTWPARDVSGSTDGVGVFLALEVSANTGAGTPTVTVSYTNSSGTAGRTGTNFNLTAATSQASSTFIIGLQAGDVGVRSVQSLTLSATWTSGTINLVAFRPIAYIPVQAYSEDAITSGLPRIYDSSTLYLMMATPSNNNLMSAEMRLTQG